MKKITLTSILALCMACPAMANIDKDASTATCDNATIGTTTGPANLQADWTANTINLKWYNGNNEISIASGAAPKTCTYDGAITLPSTPTIPTGYTFGGWRVRNNASEIQECSLSGADESLSVEESVDYMVWKPLNGSAGYTVAKVLEEGSLEGTVDRSASLNNGEWAATFDYGTVKGIAACNNTAPSIIDTINSGRYDGTLDMEQVMNLLWGTNASGVLPSNSFNQTSSGQYCWCKVTSFAEANSDSLCPFESHPWVFINDYSVLGEEYPCVSRCAYGCVYGIGALAPFRHAAYTTE